jgi:hypothetical protein
VARCTWRRRRDVTRSLRSSIAGLAGSDGSREKSDAQPVAGSAPPGDDRYERSGTARDRDIDVGFSGEEAEQVIRCLTLLHLPDRCPMGPDICKEGEWACFIECKPCWRPSPRFGHNGVGASGCPASAPTRAVSIPHRVTRSQKRSVGAFVLGLVTWLVCSTPIAVVLGQRGELRGRGAGRARDQHRWVAADAGATHGQ